MSRYPREKFVEAYKALSEIEKDILMSEKLTDKIIDISQKNGFSDDIEGRIADEVGYVLAKLEPKEKLAENFVSYINIDANIAKSIAKEIMTFIDSEDIKEEIISDRTDQPDRSPVVTAIINQFALEGNEQTILKEAVDAVENGSDTVQDLRKRLVDSKVFSYDQSVKIANAVKQVLEMPQKVSEQTPPPNLPTAKPEEENILLKQIETPVYKLSDHDHMTERHEHTPTITTPSSTPSQSPAPQTPTTQTPKTQQPQIKPQAPQTIIDQKLSQMVNIPKREVEIDLDKIEESRKNTYRGNDPYREPLE